MSRLFNDASSQYLVKTSALISAYPYTISAWVNSDDANVNQSIFAVEEAGTTNQIILQLVNGSLAPRLWTKGTGGSFATAGAGFSPNTWNHVCGVAASSTSRTVYANAANPGTDTTAVTLGAMANTYIGRLNNGGSPTWYMSGMIAEVALWNVALNLDEIVALSKKFSPRLIRPSALVGYWRLFGIDSPEKDWTKSGSDFTVTNGPTKADHIPIIGPSRSRVGLFWVNLPASPNTPSPTNGLATAGPTQLTWVSQYATTYDVYFGTAASPPLVSSGQVAASYALTGLVAGTTYFWKIVAINAGGSTTGAIWSFTANLPAAPTTPSPANASTEQTTWPTLSWAGGAGANYFDLNLGTNPAAPDALVSGLAPTVGSFIVPARLDGNTAYYWRVDASNIFGTTSASWSFTTLSRATKMVTTINGATPTVLLADVTVEDILNDAPNSCSFKVLGAAPADRAEVKIGLGDLNPKNLIFGGRINKTRQYHNEMNLGWQVDCLDYILQANKRKIRKRYSQQSATTIALDLIASYTSGLSNAGIVAGLPTVDGGIDFTDVDFLTAMTRLAQRIGGYTYIDYSATVFLFLEEVTDQPNALVPHEITLMNDPPITFDKDWSQVRTRVYVEGGGSQARLPAAAGSTTIQVNDASWYSGTGGIVVSGPQRITYTGKGAVGGPAAPTAAASLVVGNLGAGPYTYKVSQVDSGVETPLSTASTPVSIAAVADPAGSMAAANGSFGNPGSAPTAGTQTAGGSIDPDSHKYGVTYVTATGETQCGPSATGVSDRLEYPQGSMSAGTPTTGGSVPLGTHIYLVTGFSAAGEANGFTSVVVVTSGGSNAVAFSGTIQTAPDSRTTGRRIYRSDDGGANYKLIGTINDNTTTSFTDTAASGTTLWPQATANYHTIPLTAIPTGPAGTTARKIYRSKAGDANGTKYLLTTLSNNTTTTYTDSTADSALGAAEPSSNTAGGALGNGTYKWLVTMVTAQGETLGSTQATATITNGSAALTSVPTSADARVTSRRVYRTTVGGTSFALEGTINDNSTTTFTSAAADSALGAAYPAVNTTAGGGKISLTGIVTGGGTVTARKVYRTISGGSGSYKLVATIGDNTTTTLTDNVADASLGIQAPGDVTIALLGIPSIGAGSILYDIAQGDDVNIYVQVDDASAQAALAASEGGGSDGIVEHVITDRRVAENEARAMGLADLAIFSTPTITMYYCSRDPKTRSGKTVPVNLPGLNLVGNFVIQSVTISEVGQTDGWPLFTVVASNVRFSFEDALRRFKIE
jgi:hypothetical protein